MMNDTDYMQKAIQLALRANGQTSPNPAVGALVVKKGKVVGEGWHKRCGAEHAEMNALKRAGKAAKGSKLYVTLEPCGHYGRTPPCVDQIIKKDVKEVIVGIKDPNPLMNGKSIRKLRAAGIKTRVGIMKKDVIELNEAFVKFQTKRLPFVAIKSAQSLDGKISDSQGHSKWITSKETRAYSHRLRDHFDAILVGINTVLKDNPRLNGSRKSKRLKKIVLDSTLKIQESAKLFHDTRPQDCYIVTTQKASQRKLKKLREKGVNVLVSPKGSITFRWLLKELAKREIISILFEGGANVIGSALKEKVVDKAYIFIAPKIFGDANALDAVVGLKVTDVNKTFQLKKVKYKTINQDLMVSGYVYGNH